MKKFMTCLATLVLLTSAVPAFAQEGQQSPTTTATTQYSSSKISSDEDEKYEDVYQDIGVKFNYIPGADRYKWVRYNITDGYEDASGTSYTTSSKIYSLRIGKLYRIHAYAVDENNRILAVSAPVEIRGEKGWDTVINFWLK